MEELKRLRNELGWSQQKLADVSGVNKATINQVEQGKRSPSIETLEKLARAMGAEIGDFFPKAQAPLWSDNASTERRGEEGDVALSEKLQEQLNTQLKVLQERQSIARSDEDLHEAANDFHHWWLFTYDWLSAVLSVFPEAAGPRLEEAVNRVSQAHRDEVPKGAPSPRNTPDMAEVLREWSVQRNVDV